MPESGSPVQEGAENAGETGLRRAGPRLFKVVVIGDSGVGKTCLTYRFCNGRFPSKSEATIGVDFREKICLVGDESIKLQLWDTAGQERFRKSMVSHFYRNAHAVVFVYDITRKSSFESLPTWIQECNKHQLTYAMPRILVGNKCDMNDHRAVETARAQKFADLHNMPVCLVTVVFFSSKLELSFSGRSNMIMNEFKNRVNLSDMVEKWSSNDFLTTLFETSAKDNLDDHIESIFMTLVHKLKSSRPMMPEYNMRINLDSLAEQGKASKNKILTIMSDGRSSEEVEKLARILRVEDQKRLRKCEATASNFRVNGNKAYGEKDFLLALDFYAKALCFSVDFEKSAMIYGNRSAVFFEMCDYESALLDISRALKKGCSEELSLKLKIRRWKCFKLLGKSVDDEEMLSVINDSTVSESSRERQLKDFLKNKGLTSESKTKPCHAMDPPKPGCFFGAKRNALLCSGSDLVDLSCIHCVEPRFCDEKCLEEASTFHQFECGWTSFLESVGLGHLAIRILTTAGLENVVTYSVNANLHAMSNTGLLPLDSSEYSSVWRLEEHTDKVTEEDANIYEQNANLLIRWLETKTEYFGKLETLQKTYPQLDQVAIIDIVKKALMKHINQLIVNAHAIGHVMEDGQEKRRGIESFSRDEFVALRETKVATGIFPCSGMMNHSCVPNISTSFYKNVIVVRVAESVKKGDDLFNCYGPFAKRSRKVKRKKELAEQYFFECACSACRDPDDGVWAWLDAFACPECGHALSSSDEVKCNSCQSSVDVKSLENDMEKSNVRWEKGMDEFDAGISSAFNHLLSALEIRERVLFKHNRSRSVTYDTLARCYAIRRDFGKSLHFLDLSLVCVAARFGPNSIEYGYELCKYLEVAIGLAAQMSEQKKGSPLNNEIRKNVEISWSKAVKIFKTLHGPWSEMLQSLEKIREEKLLPLSFDIDESCC
ncbi:unnamed protein product [Notodromas monacha]|uniref:SET domain-containing protein n=1 Tax=Notodromas monacha TaxID=399045 RepID=A0A7R9GFJ4_9CRUS|nr:unnamed protein product [Notodromas monacha]CAG0919221.1 unnamed protein product [Notodromas monacha]